MLAKIKTYAPVQVVSAVSVFALIAVQTRFLSVSDYGLLAVLLVILECNRATLVQWVNSSLIRLYPSANDENKAQLIGLSSRVFWALSCVACGTIAVCLVAFSQWSLGNFVCVFTLFLTRAFYNYCIERARVEERHSDYRKSVLTQAIFSVVLSYIALFIEPSLFSAFSALIVSLMASIIFTWQRAPLVKEHSEQLSKTFYSYGLPFMLTGALGILAARSDRLFIAHFTSFEEAGLYAATANMLFGVMSLVFMVIALPLYPELTKLTRQPEALKRQHGIYAGYLWALSLPALVGLCILSKEVIAVFLGAKYSQVNPWIFYLVASATFIINFRYHFLDHGLQFALKTKWLPVVTTVTLAIQLITAFALVPALGALGAAIALFAAMSVAAMTSFYMGCRFGYRYALPKYWIRTLLATLVLSCGVAVTKWNMSSFSSLSVLLVCSTVGLTSYIVTHYLLNTFELRSKLVHWRSSHV